MDSTSEPQSGDRQSSPYLIPASIVVAGLIIGGAVLYSSSGSPKPAGGTTPTGGTPAGAKLDEGISLGDPNAPVTVVEFSDFQCPFCRRLYQAVLPRLKEEYVQTGKVRFVYRDFPISSIHQWAQKAAEAGRCANEEGKFWALHDIIFERQEALSETSLKQWAREIGLDGAQFDTCLDSGKYREAVLADLAAGQAAGVTGTPGTFVNGRLIQGALPYEEFKAAIEEALKNS